MHCKYYEDYFEKVNFRIITAIMYNFKIDPILFRDSSCTTVHNLLSSKMGNI